MNFSALDVAKYVISERNKVDNPLSNLELQKTLYYIQGYFLKAFGEPLFWENIINWRYGPVVVETYFRYNQFVSNGISIEYKASDMNSFGDYISTTEKAKILIDNIIKNGEDYSARELVSKTHSEDPWLETVTDQIIPISLMYRYFQSNNPLKIEV